MSTPLEIAEREAEEAEAENPDEEEAEPIEGDDSEPESQPEPAALTEKALEAMFKKLDSESDRHTKRVQEITGDSFTDLLPCPRCHPSIPGWCGPVPPEGLPPEQIAAIDISMGRGGAAEYQQAPWAVTCDICQGLGNVLSGALTEHGRLIVCKVCNGAGWVEKRELPAQPTLQAVAPTGEPVGPVYPISPDTNDQWDRPPGHAHYGIPPKFVVVPQ